MVITTVKPSSVAVVAPNAGVYVVVTGLARRKPKVSVSVAALIELLKEEAKKGNAFVESQSPPRSPRDELAAPVRSFHSYALPLMSKAP